MHWFSSSKIVPEKWMNEANMKEQRRWNFGWSFDPILGCIWLCSVSISHCQADDNRSDQCVPAGGRSLKNETSQIWLTRLLMEATQTSTTEERPLPK